MRRNGVGLALNGLARKALLLHEAVSDRIMKARFGHKHGKMTIFVCYAPTNDSDDVTKEEFYSALSRCLSTVSPHDVTVLLGDFNATVRDDMGVWRGTIGPVSPDPLNDNGLRLLELCRSHELVIANTYFQRKTIHQYTWYSNDGRTKKMIDYVIISKRWRSSLKNCRTYRSAELGNADHRLVCADVQLRLHAQRSERKPVAADIGKLKEPYTRQKYSVEISNRFELLGTLNNSEDAWKYFKSQTSEAAQLVLGKRSFPKKSWLTDETLQVIEQRRRARLLGDMATYRRLNGVRNRLIHRDRTQFVARKADEIELAAKKKDMGSLFKHLRDLTENKTPALGPVLSRDGTLLSDEGSCLERWKDHFCSLLNNTSPSMPPTDSPSQPGSPRSETDAPPDEPFSPSEIGNAVKRLKNNKAAGICGLSAELLKYAGPVMLLFLHTLFSTIWQTEIIPEDWRKGVIIPLWKRKGSRSDCSNYRGITLLSVPGKLFSMVLLDRCRNIIRKIRRPEQAGFMSDRSTIEQIFTIRQIIEKATEFRQKAFFTFVDFRAAFDSVDREALWRILESTGLPEKYCRLFKALHHGTESCVQVNGRRSPFFQITTGVRQGCAVAPELFNVIIDYVMTRTTSRLSFGLKFGDRVITDADFADDLAILADSMEQLLEALRILREEAAKVGLQINWTKTKIMAIDPSSPAANPSVSLDSTTSIEVVQRFTYLGSIISSDGSLLSELQARISKASSAMGRLNRHLWRKPNISRTTKLRIFNALVGSVMLYGAETWQASAATLKAIDVFQSKSLRRIEGLRWFDFVSNEKLLQLTKQSRFSTQAAERTLRWFGHLLRMPPHIPAKTIHDFDPVKAGWKRPRGRPKKRWSDSLSEFLAMANIRLSDVQTLAMDRSGWRRQTSLSTPSSARQET